jgi:hypothetical protein
LLVTKYFVQESKLNLSRPIKTYNGRGVSKPGVVNAHHAIAFSGEFEPEPQSFERPLSDHEQGMIPGIRITPKNKYDKLDIMSRIDFSRMYTVEDNVKVYNFGQVHPDYIPRLRSQWAQVVFSDLFERGDADDFDLKALLAIPEVEEDSESDDTDDADTSDGDHKKRSKKKKEKSSKEKRERDERREKREREERKERREREERKNRGSKDEKRSGKSGKSEKRRR